MRIVLHRRILRRAHLRRRHEERFINVFIRDVRARIGTLFAVETPSLSLSLTLSPLSRVGPPSRTTSLNRVVNHTARPTFAPLIAFIVPNVAPITKAQAEQSGMQGYVCTCVYVYTRRSV